MQFGGVHYKFYINSLTARKFLWQSWSYLKALEGDERSHFRKQALNAISPFSIHRPTCSLENFIIATKRKIRKLMKMKNVFNKKSLSLERSLKCNELESMSENLFFFYRFQTCASNMVRNNDGIVSLFSGIVRTHENLVAVSRKHENFFPCSLSIVNVHVGTIWHMVSLFDVWTSFLQSWFV